MSKSLLVCVKKLSNSYEQLLGYMEAKGVSTGYLLTFEFSKNPKVREPK